MILLTVIVASHALADELEFSPNFKYLQKTLINSQRVTTVAEGLERLKAEPKFGDLFRNYALGFDSKSLQSSTPLNPRAILFGATARLIVSFNGTPTQEGGFSLEVAEFEPVQNKVLFREIIFKSEIPNEIRQILNPRGLKDTSPTDLQNALALVPSDIAFENSRLAITKSNPGKCLQCHSLSESVPSEASYIWKGYQNWPGFYGSNDDGYSRNPEEWQNLEVFKKKNLATHNQAANARYATLETFMTSQNFTDNPKLASIGFRPNLRMTMLIALHQARVNSRILGSKIYEADADAVKTSFCKFPTKGPIVEILKGVMQPNFLLATSSSEKFNAAEESWIGGTKLDRYVLAEVTRDKLTSLDPEFNHFFESQKRDNHFVYYERQTKGLDKLQVPDTIKSDWLRFINYFGPHAGPWDRHKFESTPFYIKTCADVK